MLTFQRFPPFHVNFDFGGGGVRPRRRQGLHPAQEGRGVRPARRARGRGTRAARATGLALPSPLAATGLRPPLPPRPQHGTRARPEVDVGERAARRAALAGLRHPRLRQRHLAAGSAPAPRPPLPSAGTRATPPPMRTPPPLRP